MTLSCVTTKKTLLCSKEPVKALFLHEEPLKIRDTLLFGRSEAWSSAKEVWWYHSHIKVVYKWYEILPKWYESGTIVVQKWHQSGYLSGTKDLPQWF